MYSKEKNIETKGNENATIISINHDTCENELHPICHKDDLLTPKRKNAKKKIVITLICVIFPIIALSCLYYGYTQYVNHQLQDYASEVQRYTTELNISVNYLTKLNDEWESVNDYPIAHYETIKNLKHSMFSSYITNVKSSNVQIEVMYNEIIKCKIKGPNVEKLKSHINNVQCLYRKIYNLIIIDERGGNSIEIRETTSEITEIEKILKAIKQ